MTIEQSAIYKCTGEDCTVQMEVVYGCPCEGPCEMTCGSDKLEKLQEQTADASNEKHVPIMEKTDDGVKVTVGSTLHPMKDEHWIQWIELQCADCKMVMRKYLDPGDEPIAVFPCPCDPGKLVAREHCNVHGLWKGTA